MGRRTLAIILGAALATVALQGADGQPTGAAPSIITPRESDAAGAQPPAGDRTPEQRPQRMQHNFMTHPGTPVGPFSPGSGAETSAAPAAGHPAFHLPPGSVRPVGPRILAPGTPVGPLSPGPGTATPPADE